MNKIVKYSDEWFLSLYLKHGSVEEAIRSYPDSLPISTANYHRMVKKYGLIGSAGRHVSLPETLHFFRKKAFEPNTPLEKIYRNMPPSFQTSLSTLHRIYQHIERQAVRRHAAALIISSEDNNENILLGTEVFGNSRYGKRAGDRSVPMGFAKVDEGNCESLLRVLQQEVFSGLAQKGRLQGGSALVKSIIGENPEPFSYFDIVDVRVKIFNLRLPKKFCASFESYKLIDHKFENINQIDRNNLRAGIGEILGICTEYLHNPYTVKFPAYFVSSINSLVVSPALE